MGRPFAALPYPGPAGGGVRLLQGHDRPAPHYRPYPRWSDAGAGTGCGRGRRAGCILLPPGIPQKCPASGRDLHLLRQGRGRRCAPPHGQSPAGDGGKAAAHRPHHAHLSPDGGADTDYGGQGRAPGTGPVPRPAGRCAAGRDPAGTPSVLCRVCLREHPLSCLGGGAEHRASASGI